MGKIVSALIPTRNRTELALKAIKSVLLQTYSSIEVIVTDNSDTDELRSLIIEIGDSRVFYEKNAENIGPILNWRRALQIAKGDYCFILPDDDYLINPFYIEDAVRILDKGSVRMVVPDCILNYPSRNEIATSSCIGNKFGQDFIRDGNHIPHIANIFLREDAFRHNAFQTNEILWADFELWRKIMSSGSVYCYPVPSVLYLFHNDNIVLNMTRSQLITNSSFIRSSVESFAEDGLVAALLVRYLCAVNSINGKVDSEFVRSTIRLNHIDSKSLYVFIQFWLGSAKQRLRRIISKAKKVFD